MNRIKKNIVPLEQLILLLMALIGTSGSGQQPAEKSEQPNIIVIFTDDHGYADLGVQGQVDDVKTPNIDQLAKAVGNNKIRKS